MKINYPQLQAQLKKSLAPVYLVSGDEIFLKQEACALITEAATQAGFTERSRCMIDTSTDDEQLYSLLYSPSLLGEKKRIELDLRQSNPSKMIAAILTEYFKNPAPANLLLLDIGKLDAKITKSAWYQALEKIGTVVTIWPIAKEQLPQWIMQRAHQSKLILNQEAAHLISDFTDGNLTAAAQVLEKIALLTPNQTVELADLQKLLADENRFSMFDWVENMIAGNIARSLQILDHLKLEGIEPTLILWALTRELRILADCANKLKQGAVINSLLQQQRIFFSRQIAFKKFLQRYSAEDCWLFLSQASEMDKMIKGASPGNIWEAMQRFCLKLI